MADQHEILFYTLQALKFSDWPIFLTNDNEELITKTSIAQSQWLNFINNVNLVDRSTETIIGIGTAWRTIHDPEVLQYYVWTLNAQDILFGNYCKTISDFDKISIKITKMLTL